MMLPLRRAFPGGEYNSRVLTSDANSAADGPE